MAISLQDINQSNYEAVCELDVTEQQEAYVACNMWSLVEAFYNGGYTCKAIYDGDQPVGFLMWVQESAIKMSIWRFMVDKKCQGKGIGRTALTLALDLIRKTPGVQEIEICYNPKNPVAREFYSTFGFHEIGMDEDGEDMLALITL